MISLELIKDLDIGSENFQDEEMRLTCILLSNCYWAAVRYMLVATCARVFLEPWGGISICTRPLPQRSIIPYFPPLILKIHLHGVSVSWSSQLLILFLYVSRLFVMAVKSRIEGTRLRRVYGRCRHRCAGYHITKMTGTLSPPVGPYFSRSLLDRSNLLRWFWCQSIDLSSHSVLLNFTQTVYEVLLYSNDLSFFDERKTFWQLLQFFSLLPNLISCNSFLLKLKCLLIHLFMSVNYFCSMLYKMF